MPIASDPAPLSSLTPWAPVANKSIHKPNLEQRQPVSSAACGLYAAVLSGFEANQSLVLRRPHTAFKADFPLMQYERHFIFGHYVIVEVAIIVLGAVIEPHGSNF